MFSKFFGQVARIVLSIVNIILFLIGAGLIVIGCLIKWSNESLKSLHEINDIKKLIDLATIDIVLIVIICIGGLLVIISCIGLIGVCCLNRGFLFIYELIILVLFITHLGGLIYVLVSAPQLESQFRKDLNKTIDDLNSNNISADAFDSKCYLIRNLSNIFECCGANGPEDFKSLELRTKCCVNDTTTKGCSDETMSKLKQYSIYYLIIPSAVIFIVELFAIVTIPILIYQISLHLRKEF
jgi:hypothetical protein